MTAAQLRMLAAKNWGRGSGTEWAVMSRVTDTLTPSTFVTGERCIAACRARQRPGRPLWTVMPSRTCPTTLGIFQPQSIPICPRRTRQLIRRCGSLRAVVASLTLQAIANVRRAGTGIVRAARAAVLVAVTGAWRAEVAGCARPATQAGVVPLCAVMKVPSAVSTICTCYSLGHGERLRGGSSSGTVADGAFVRGATGD